MDNDGNALLTGALYWNSVGNVMYVYTGSSWVAAGSAVNGTSERSVYTATSGQTTFSATYDVGYVDVYLNGSKLVATSDFTANDGVTVVLATGATTGDVIDIVAYAAFELANVYTQSQSDARFLRVSNNLSDLASASTARSNLGLGTAATTASSAYATAAQGALADSALQSSAIGTTVQAYDADLTTWAGKTAPTGTVVGTSDTQTLTNKTIEAGTLTNGYTEEVYALGTSGSIALNPANGSIQTCSLTGNPTFTDSLASGQSIVLHLANGSSYTVTYPTMTWVGPTGNTAPTLNSGNVLVFWKVSTTLYGANVGKYA